MVPAADEADPATAVGGRSPGHGEGIEFDDEPGWPRALVWLTRALHVAGALWTVALMLLINADVIGRNAFDTPVRGVSELVGLSIVGIVFLQLADTLRCGRFTRADVWLAPLRRRRPALAAALQALHAALGTALMAVMLWAAWPQFLDVARVGEYVGALGDFTAPLWPVRLLIVLGLGLTALTFAIMALAQGRRAWRLRQGARAQADGAQP